MFPQVLGFHTCLLFIEVHINLTKLGCTATILTYMNKTEAKRDLMVTVELRGNRSSVRCRAQLAQSKGVP